ncbi:S-adenosyl-L-homocysteine hydrolase [Sphingomonas antarctica]
MLAIAVPAGPAQAACWSAEHISAAKVRDLDTMLMVSALRCRRTDVSMMDAYNRFVVQDRKALVKVNDTLRDHYRDAGNSKAQMGAYDTYVTKVANRYGAGSEGLSCAEMRSIVDATAAEAPQVEALIAVAERAGIRPLLDGPACEGPFSTPAMTTAAAVIGRR